MNTDRKNTETEQCTMPVVRLSLDELKRRCSTTYDEMVRLKKDKMMVWYRAEKNKYIELRDELDRRGEN